MNYNDITVKDTQMVRPPEYAMVERKLEDIREMFDNDASCYVVQLLNIIKQLCDRPVEINQKEYFSTLSPDNPPDYVHEYVRKYTYQPGRTGKLYSELLDVLDNNGVISDFSSKPPYLQAQEYFERRKLDAPRGIEVVLTKTYRVGSQVFNTLEEATQYCDKLQADDEARRNVIRECLQFFAAQYTNDRSLSYGADISLKPDVTIGELALTIAHNISYVSAALKNESLLGRPYTEFIQKHFDDIVAFVLNHTRYDEFSGSHFFRRS